MKIMKSCLLLGFNLTIFYFLYYIFILTEPAILCGGKLTKEVVESSIRLNQHIIEFTAASGKKYKLLSTLYKIDEKFATAIELINETGIEITTWDLYNSYRHAVFTFCVTDLKDYINIELSDKLFLSKAELDVVHEKLLNLMINMFCTKHAMLDLMKTNKQVLTIQNYLFEEKLLNGTIGKQFLSTLFQVFKTPELQEILLNFYDEAKLNKITDNKPLQDILQKYAVNFQGQQLIESVIGDLVRLVDPKWSGNIENRFIFNQYKVERIDPYTMKPVLKKFFIEQNKLNLEDKKFLIQVTYGLEESLVKDVLKDFKKH